MTRKIDERRKRLMNLLMLREAIASVALSHDEGCECDTCKAATGDKEAWQRIVAQHLGFEIGGKVREEVSDTAKSLRYERKRSR
jgi:hypothetical protein